jgi:hypothetical protein
MSKKEVYACFQDAFTDISEKAVTLSCTKDPVIHNIKRGHAVT